MNSKRQKMIEEIPWFVRRVAKIEGVRKISLLGSITTDKADPKDIDFLVTVDDDAELRALASVGRKLKGHTGSAGGGADIFLANEEGHYIGCTCQWKECWPGRRLSCEALNCGGREYLYDDLQRLKLSDEVVKAAIELWPRRDENVKLPQDVESVLGSED